ncbi:MAG: nucleotidyltransferase [Bacteroidia bacterium]|nr:nucleotidyltransferase [Bacteroidia bacterium]
MSKLNALIPMAGAGSRFKDEGYTTPKPLLDILGKPMVVSAADALPKADNYTFVVRDFQINEFNINQHLENHFLNPNIIILDHLTEGQAVTCLSAKEFINNDEQLVIGASDNGMIYDREKFDALKLNADAIVFTFRNNPAVIPKPQAYGWIKTDGTDQVIGASVKVPISNSPMNDHAIVGAFWFAKGKYFVEAAERMIDLNRRINNEFYVDECINDLIELEYKVKVFEIDHYVCWGTPNDYKSFKYWDEWFSKINNW